MRESTIYAFLGGLALGALVGILLAPQKGEDTRRVVKDTLDDLLAKAKSKKTEYEADI